MERKKSSAFHGALFQQLLNRFLAKDIGMGGAIRHLRQAKTVGRSAERRAVTVSRKGDISH
jgi:hypothetical protein